MKRCLGCLLLFSVTAMPMFAVDSSWPNWRGPYGNGCAAPGKYPTKWNVESVRLKKGIPGKGISTPVVWKNRIYLTTVVRDKDSVLALSKAGKVIWTRSVGKARAGKHPKSSGSNSSPVTDGELIYAFFKSGTLVALDLDGEIRWSLSLFDRYGADLRFWDFGTSPVLTNNDVILAEMHDGDSWLAAFDKKTGQERWKVSRNFETPKEGSHGYATPQVFTYEGKEAILVWGALHVTIHDASSGKLLASYGGFNPEGKPLRPAVASTLICDGMVIVPFGSSDHRWHSLHGILLGAQSAAQTSRFAWERKDTGAFVPTPAVYRDRVYLLRDRGEIECIDPKTGKTIKSGVLPRGRGKYYASPLIAGDHLYAAREDGTVFVVSLKNEFEVVSIQAMNEKIYASPIAVSSSLVIRTVSNLYCIGMAK